MNAKELKNISINYHNLHKSEQLQRVVDSIFQAANQGLYSAVQEDSLSIPELDYLKSIDYKISYDSSKLVITWL